MKLRNIPEDIKNKSLNDLKRLISALIEELENEKDLNNSIEKYNKLILINNFIEDKFKKKAKEISFKTFNFLKKYKKK